SESTGRGDQGQSDDDGVEAVPGIPEEPPPVGVQLHRELHGEHRHRGAIDQVQQPAVPGHQGRGGFQAEGDRVGEDHRDDQTLEGPCFDQCANALTHAQHRTPDRGRSTIQDQLIELVTLLSWSVTHGTGWCGPLPVICRKMRGSSGAGTDGCGTARRRRSSNGQAEWTFRRGSPRGWMSAIRGEEGDFSTAWWQEGSLAADVAVLFARVPVERRHPRAQPAWGAPGAQGHRGPPLGVRWTATMVLGRTPNVSRGRDFSEKILHILLGGARRHRG